MKSSVFSLVKSAVRTGYSRMSTRTKAANLGTILLTFSFLLVSFAAWLTHVIVCLKTASWGFLIAGALVAPIAVIHGVGLWFGLF